VGLIGPVLAIGSPQGEVSGMGVPGRDRLVEALVVRAILQGASSPERIMAVLAPLGEDEVLPALGRLVRSGMVVVRAGEYVVTEEGLEMVRRVAEMLEEVQADNGARLPEESRDLEPLLYAMGFLTLAPEEEAGELGLASE